MKTRFAHASRTTSPALREGQDKRALPSPLPLGEGQGEGALPSPLPPGEGQGEGAPRGFTLVELLVVLGIIGLLAALLTPAVMQSLTKARNAAIKAEIDMLHMAIMNYQSEYGAFPPALDIVLGPGSAAGKHLLRIFPRCPRTSVVAQLTAPFTSVPFQGTPPQITGTNAIVYWLSGFTTDPRSPLLPPASRVKLFDFDRARFTSSGGYAPAGKPNSPYLYIDSNLYDSIPYTSVNTPGAFHETQAGDATPFINGPGETDGFFNKDTFQILCAGRDEQFGTDDDLSNFWPGTRREYLDSLKD